MKSALILDKSYADYFYAKFDITNGDIQWTKHINSFTALDSHIENI